MAQYTGDKAESLPSKRTEGEVSEPSMTLDGIARVTVTDGANAPGTPLPGSSPDFPIFTQSLEGEKNQVRAAGGELDRIREPVAIAGPVTILLNAAQLAALLPKSLALDSEGRLAVRPPNAENKAGDDPENVIWTGSLDGSRNHMMMDAGELTRIVETVNVRGTVMAQLGAQGDAILGLAADSAAIRAIFSRPTPPLDPIFPPEFNSTMIDGVVKSQPITTNWNRQTALIVSNATPVLLAGANADRKSLVITNNSTGSLYLGGPNVTASGITAGLLVPTTGSYSDSGDGVFTGEVWGLYSASASAQNIAVSDRS